MKQKIVKIHWKTFTDEVNFTKTMKIFPLKSFAAYGMLPGIQMVYRKMNTFWVCKSQGHSEAAVINGYMLPTY